MKINWGTGIVLAFIGFISFILYFVIVATTDERASHDLVTDDYYEQELAFQDEIDAEKNARKFSGEFSFKKVESGLQVNWPAALREKNIQAQVSLYRPSNKHLDFDLSVNLSNSHLLIPDNRLLDGRWDIKFRWTEAGEDYLIKKSLTY